MSKNNFTIHIGPHKTGTTYIQKCMIDNRPELLNSGVFYPKLGQELYYGHHNLVNLIKHQNHKLLEEFLKSIPDNVQNILVSSENFDTLSEKDIRFLKSWLKSYNVKIIYFKRDLPSLLFSTWQEDVKHGDVTTWSEFFFQHLIFPYRSKIINQNIILDKYCAIFGLKSIDIVDYNEVLQQNNDIATILTRIVGANLKLRHPNKAANASLPPAITEIIRALNQMFANEKKLHILNVREAFLKTNNAAVARPKIKELISIIDTYSVPLSLDNSPVIKTMTSHFLTQYKDNIITSEKGSSASSYPKSSAKRFPSSNWLCDQRGQKLLFWLKDKVEINLEM